jgi:peptide/nickel transport system substrate-binding protein
MENRFGVKDFFLFLLVGGLIVLVIVSMFMFDRQYKQVILIKDKTEALTQDIVAIQNQLQSGVVVGSGGDGGTRQALPREKEVFKLLAAAEKMPNFARGDWLVDNFGTKLPRMTPLVSSDTYQRMLETRVMEWLVTRDPEDLTKYNGLLAESWDVKDNSKEWEEYTKPLRDKGLTFDQINEQVKKDPKAPMAQVVTFKLRRGVTFSDGSPMTAEDVVFTFNWILNPEVDAPRDRSYMVYLKDVKADGPHEVTFNFASPYYANFEVAGGTSIMSKKFYGRFKPQEFNEKTGLLFGTGPYRLEDPENWAPGKPIELVRNVRYWGVPPTFDRLVYREVEDESAEMVMLGNGEIDILVCQPEQYEKLLKDPRVTAKTQHLKYFAPTGGHAYIGWNQRRKGADGKENPTPMADKRVRQAMTMLIDRERIVREVLLGYGMVASGPFDPHGPQSAPDVKPWPFDESRAKALLAQAGFADRNGDGVIDGPDNQPFRFKLSYPSGSATYERVVLFLKDSLARGGVVMEPDPVQWSVLLDKIKRGEFDACHLRWGGGVEFDIYQIFHTSQIKDQGDNRTAYSNPKLDELIEKARRTIDDAERMKIWHEVHRILHEDQPYTFMFNQPSLRFVGGRIQNVGVTKLGLTNNPYYPNPVPWFVPKAQQKYAK